MHVGMMEVAAGLATTGEETVAAGSTGVVVAATGGVVAAATGVDEMIGWESTTCDTD